MKRVNPLLACLLLGAATAHAASNAAQRNRAFEQLPDWTGIWIADDGVMSRLGLRNDVQGDAGPTFKDILLASHPPYNAEWEGKYRLRMQHLDQLRPKECAFYFPSVMESPWVFQILVTPEETALIFAGREVRHVYTDKRRHPPADERWPTPWGDSVGHWEGQTLIVNTVAVAPFEHPAGILLSPSAQFTERIRKVSADKLEDQITIDDPAALQRAWTLTIPYKRVTSIDRIVHGDCQENDRNPVVNGEVTIAPASR